MAKLDEEALKALKSIAGSLERIAHALRDDGGIDVSLAEIASGFRNERMHFDLNSIGSSVYDIAEAIREQRSKPGDDAAGDAAKPDPE